MAPARDSSGNRMVEGREDAFNDTAKGYDAIEFIKQTKSTRGMPCVTPASVKAVFNCGVKYYILYP
jgi:hypothetical protein